MTMMKDGKMLGLLTFTYTVPAILLHLSAKSLLFNQHECNSHTVNCKTDLTWQ